MNMVQTPTASSHSTVNRCISVLLVDDQMIVAEGVRRMLDGEKDIELHFCDNPGEAIQTAIDVHATVILQDLVMPDVDGLTLVRFYRANPDTMDIPIIVLSSKEDPEVKRDAFTNGASDYLVKLPDRIELIARIRAHSQSYLARQERDAAFAALRETQKQLEESNRKLKMLSTLDGLTGIANRRKFDESLELEWRRSCRNRTEFCLIMIDIDYFKQFNDAYGHQKGDECLVAVTNVLSEHVSRPADVVARYGGEEFVVILPETHLAGACMLADRMCAAVQALGIPHERSQAADTVTISLGVACILPDCDDPADTILNLADSALYEAKEEGRNRVKAHETPD